MKKIWIDLDNSPHVPFFKPIIKALEGQGHSILVTARDCFQVCDLADLLGVQYKRIGRHYGKASTAKMLGMGVRTLQLLKEVINAKPDLAISHGSRSMFVSALCLGIPNLTIVDYEHIKWFGFSSRRSWLMVPEMIPKGSLRSLGFGASNILNYPGIKEDVYASSLRPSSDLRGQLGIAETELIVAIRPPATNAHYHTAESDVLLDAVFALVEKTTQVTGILVPRTAKQDADLRGRWPQLFQTRKMIIPCRVMDGLDLIGLSDLVISGGGTMNREAAALGVPVYSIFRGKLGAVDRYLSEHGRLVLISSVEDVQNKIRLVRKDRGQRSIFNSTGALQGVMDNIFFLLDRA